jgi:hypothetical protein
VRNSNRDALLRETYRLNHEIGYVGFRHRYFDDPDAVKEWPDPALRERELRSFWDSRPEEGFASYRETQADVTIQVLAAYRDYLHGILAGNKDGQIAYYDRVAAQGRRERLHEDGFSEDRTEGMPLSSPGGHAARTVPSLADLAEEGGVGRYQVWHANDIEAVHQSRMEREPYVQGYTFVADVEARDLQHAVELTVHGFRDWRMNPEVKISVVGSRSTAAGDVLFDPRGQGYRFEGHRSFSEVEPAALLASSPADLVERSGGAVPQQQNMNTKRYFGVRAEEGVSVFKEAKDGRIVPLPMRNDLRNHSPTGAEWGYGGSGPAQLALAILCDAIGEELALGHYQDFKFAVVSRFKRDQWEMSGDAVQAWYQQNRRPEQKYAQDRKPSPAELVERAGPPSPRVTGGHHPKPKL